VLLEGVAPGLVEGVDRREVAVDPCVVEGAEPHAGEVREAFAPARGSVDQADPRHHLVLPTGQPVQHGHGLGQVRRLAKRLTIDPHQRVGPDHQGPRMGLRHRRRLEPGVLLAQRADAEPGIVEFGRIAGQDLEVRHQGPEQLDPAGGGRGEHEGRRRHVG